MVDTSSLWANVQSYADLALDWVKKNPQWTLPAIFVLAFGESIAFVSLLLPFWAMLVALGPILTGSGYSFFGVLAASAAGAAIGDWVSYWIGHHFHDRLPRMWPFTRHPGILEKGHAFFEKKGGEAAIWIARFSGPLRASVPIIAGAARMPHWKFQRANWLSAIFWAGILLGFGDVVGKAYHHFMG